MRSRFGFTIVELLIVIVVIAILAAIVIVSYNGIRRSAIETSLKSDLRNGSAQLELDNNDTGDYPASVAAANGGKGLPASSGTTLTYTQVSSDYCLSAVSSSLSGSPFYISSKSRKIAAGDCTKIASTYAGTGTYGANNGPIASAQFGGPYGIDVDVDGTIYIAECYNNRIRKITPAGTVSTLAGTGASGSNNGPGISATFSCPDGIAVNSAGEVFVGDAYNGLIRKITPTGDVSTFASGLAPTGIVIDAQGVLYIASGHRVQKVSTTGTVTTLAGSTTSGYVDDPVGSVARFNYLNGIALDGAGNVYVADGFNRRIRMITPSGAVSTVAGSGVQGFADGTGTAAQFGVPYGIASTTDGTLFVTDGNNDRVRMITPAKVVTTLSGGSGFQDGPATTARFAQPRGITLDGNRDLYIADIDNNRIRKITLP